MVNQIRDLNIAFGGLFFLLKYTSVLINCWQLQSQKMSSHHLKNLLPSKITKVGLKVVMHTNAIHFLRLYYCPTQSFRIRCYFFPLPRFVRFFFSVVLVGISALLHMIVGQNMTPREDQRSLLSCSKPLISCYKSRLFLCSWNVSDNFHALALEL